MPSNRVCLGRLYDGSMGLLVSPPGYDVMLAASRDRALFDSQANVIRVTGKGQASMGVGVNSIGITLPNLGAGTQFAIVRQRYLLGGTTWEMVDLFGGRTAVLNGTSLTITRPAAFNGQVEYYSWLAFLQRTT